MTPTLWLIAALVGAPLGVVIAVVGVFRAWEWVIDPREPKELWGRCKP